MRVTRTELHIKVPNQPGELFKLATLMQRERLNILAMMMREADAGDLGDVYLIPDQPETAREMLSDNGYTVKSNDVICIELVNRPGQMASLMSRLSNAGINVNYGYVSSHYRGEPTFLILRVNRLLDAVDLLQGR